MSADLAAPFDPACCEGSAAADNALSAQPCGCDKRAHWTCAQHRPKAYDAGRSVSTDVAKQAERIYTAAQEAERRKSYINDGPCMLPNVDKVPPERFLQGANPPSKSSPYGAAGMDPEYYRPRHASVLVGVGGAPLRASTLPTSATLRKTYPVASGVLDYFPDALVAVSHVSWQGNEQHNPGQELHWAREKSMDEADTMMRHFLERGTLDYDGVRHSAKMVWRALALLQKEIESEQPKGL